MNIFHSNGRIRTDIDPGKILGDRRAAFNALVAAQVACEQAEANEKVANSKVEECVRIHNEAVARVPRTTFHDEWKRMVGHMAVTSEQPERVSMGVRPEPVAEPTDHSAGQSVPPPHDPYVALKAADHALNLARQEARGRRDATLKARAAFSEALERWNHAQPVMTQEQALREYVNTSQADRARRAAAGQAVYHPGITRTAQAIGAGGHNVKRGGGTSFRRGAYTRAQAMEIEARKLQAAALAAKPPSQR